MTDRPLDVSRSDVVLIGAGMASATLAALLTDLEPDWDLTVLERLEGPGREASSPWNNAGTGHSALCELNYTPQAPDGSVDPAKAIGVNEQFQVSRQYWAHLVESGRIADPGSFIHPVPHLAFVRGTDNVAYLQRRHEALRDHPLFQNMELTRDLDVLREWTPLIAEGRPLTENFAATRTPEGSDLDFGALARELIGIAEAGGTSVAYGREVVDIRRIGDLWGVMSRDVATGAMSVVAAPFLFVGGGGAALELLQKSGIEEIRGYGVFTISGQFLRCTDEEVAARHDAKVYGKAAVGAPPMSVPHLDTRIVDGKPALLFGPYAGFSPKVLKSGSYLDLFRTVKPGNLLPNLAVARDNLDLVSYLASQITQSPEQRFEALTEFYPEADPDQWELITAGQRAQVIAPDAEKTGVLQFGTELITSADGSIGGMLGASPGASTATNIMLTLLERSFPDRFDAWRERIREMIPSYGTMLSADPEAASASLDRTARVLGLHR